MALTCYECGKIIKGKVIHHVPTMIEIELGTDFQKAFHPKCYDRAEEKARIELQEK